MKTKKAEKENHHRKILHHSIKMSYKEYAEEPMADYYGQPLIGIPSRVRVKKIVQCLHEMGGKVLEVGCEAGYVCQFLSKNIPATIFGFDPCIPALMDFKKRNDSSHKKVSICAALAQEICFRSKTFDAVVCTEVIEHTPHIDGIFAELSRVLKDGGAFILTFPYERLRKIVYPVVKYFGINTDVEKEVTLFNYGRREIEEKLGLQFSIVYSSLIFKFFPITYFYCCRKKHVS
jgi:ubiquinone/menaquinone biosynthesis C-methylase UbiE